MKHKPNHKPNDESRSLSDQHPTDYVDARYLGAKYRVSARYILILAADNRIPSLRLGKKCVRFSESAVAAALEEGVN